MKIQFNTDVNIDGTEALADQVNTIIEQALIRFEKHITRIEVHLSDENADKKGLHDHRCMLEARIEGRQPISVIDVAATLEQSVHGATQKLVHLLESTLSRAHDLHKRH